MADLKFENILAYYCSPVLTGAKVSNLVSISKNELPEYGRLVKYYNDILKKYDIKINPICECGQRILVFVYKQAELYQYLKKTDINTILSAYGYSSSWSLNRYITRLKTRMIKGDFPHEIGAFLGYPVLDIKGFIENKGKNYKYSGYWKVYGNTEEAKELFDLYDKSRYMVMEKMSCGECLENILGQFKNQLYIA
nr:DUF3793 family protein [uncultured Peptostreptococcus sp.]